MLTPRTGGRFMFNIGAMELILILLIAFIVVGPKDLPKIARFLGRMVRKARSMIRDIKQETGFDEVEEELKETQRDIAQTIKEADIREDLKATRKDLDDELKTVRKDADISAEMNETRKEIKDSLKSSGKSA